MRDSRFVLFLRALAVAAPLVAAAAPARAQPAEFHVFLLPEENAVEPGDTARVRLEVDASAREFNGYRAILRYRPAVVDSSR